VDSDAHSKLKKEEEERGKPAWVVKVLKNPPSLVIGRGGEYIHTLSVEELKDVMRGFFPKDYYMDVLVDTESGQKVHIKHLIDLSRYGWLPRYMYRRFLRAACEILDIEYKVEMLDLVTSTRLTPKALVIFPEKSVFEKAEKRTAEIKVREDAMKREIDNIREMMKVIKEEKK